MRRCGTHSTSFHCVAWSTKLRKHRPGGPQRAVAVEAVALGHGVDPQLPGPAVGFGPAPHDSGRAAGRCPGAARSAAAAAPARSRWTSAGRRAACRARPGSDARREGAATHPGCGRRLRPGMPARSRAPRRHGRRRADPRGSWRAGYRVSRSCLHDGETPAFGLISHWNPGICPGSSVVGQDFEACRMMPRGMVLRHRLAFRRFDLCGLSAAGKEG